MSNHVLYCTTWIDTAISVGIIFSWIADLQLLNMINKVYLPHSLNLH